MENSQQKIYTFLMFSGQAEEALRFYTSCFDKTEIISITRYRENEDGKEGKVAQASFSIHGQDFMCTDSNVEHAFTFTPAISLYIKCNTKDEINQVFDKLSQNGNVLMPLAAYPFSNRFS